MSQETEQQKYERIRSEKAQERAELEAAEKGRRIERRNVLLGHHPHLKTQFEPAPATDPLDDSGDPRGDVDRFLVEDSVCVTAPSGKSYCDGRGHYLRRRSEDTGSHYWGLTDWCPRYDRGLPFAPQGEIAYKRRFGGKA